MLLSSLKRYNRNLSITKNFLSSLSNKSSSSPYVIYKSKSNNPFFNIAFEQWLFNKPQSNDERILYLWCNGPSVIIGKFQSAWKECNGKL
jgi:lipoate-protein ligase A